MSPNLRRLGAVLVAVVALSHVASSTAPAAQFTTEKYPTTFEPTGNEGTGAFTTEAGTSRCKKITTSATLSGASSTVTVNAAFAECSATLFGTATKTAVAMNGCYYTLHVTEGSGDKYKGSGDLVCPTEKEVFGTAFISGVPVCEIHIPEQAGAVQVELTDNTTNKTVEGKLTSSKVHYTVTLDSGACPFNGTGTKTDGKLEQSQPAVVGGKEKPAVID